MSAKTDSFRPLTGDETARLAAQGNWASDWSGVRVAVHGFDISGINRCVFDGNVGIGAGVTMLDARVAAAGDARQCRIDVINENGGRAILPCPEMTCADALIMAKYRGDNELMAKTSTISSGGNYGAYTPQTIIGDDAFIGPGVQIRNSIIGRGNTIDSAAQLENVMTGENASIGKAARIAHSFVGDCAHIACCEIANCHIAPFHSQHHNNSFLIAARVGGQSNVAAGATIGSNHNGRTNDGEIWAKRGFWPGLCVSLKHNSRFASFTMIAKGDYPAELDVKLPFSLIVRDEKSSRAVIHPAFWFTRNMYAAMRCQLKFKSRDNRKRRAQFVEHDMLAPDTVEEIFEAIRLLENAISAEAGAAGRTPLTMERGYPSTQIKYAEQAIGAYRMMIRHYCAQNVLPFMRDNGINGVDGLVSAVSGGDPVSGYNDKWLNCGGTVIAESALANITTAIKSGGIHTWADVNALFDNWVSTYKIAKVKHAVMSLARLEDTGVNQLTDNMLRQFAVGVPKDCETIVALTRSSRQKDYSDPFRTMIYDSAEEMEAVLGSFDNDPVITGTVEAMNALSSAAISVA